MLRSVVFGLASLLCLTGSSSALDRTGPTMEARVYFDGIRSLQQLGELAGQLDICTWVKDEPGGYLLINTNAAQLEQIRAAGLLVDVTYSDIRQKFFEMTGVRPGDLDTGRDFGFYLTYQEVADTLARLAAAYSAICTTFTLGSSFEGRSLWCLKISDNPGTVEGEPACFVNGATHAREPLSTHCCVAFATRLLSEYGRDSVSTWLVDNREVYIVPVMNPDGYAYNSDSGGAESNWRKNRRSPVPLDIGIDLNRNYGYKWGHDNYGSSFRPRDETYRGPAPFSEPETRLIRDFLATYRPRTGMDLHAFGRYNMYPWGYGSAEPPDERLLRQVVDTFQANNRYPISLTGQVYSTIYPCNGMSVDWEYSDTAGKSVTYAFTCEIGITDFWFGWYDSSYIRSECDLNIPNLYYLARVAGAYFRGVSVAVDDSAEGDGDGQLEPGESAGVWFVIANQALHPMDSAYAISGRLTSGSADVQVLTSEGDFPNIMRAGTGDNHASQFSVRASGALASGVNTPLRLELSYRDDGRSYTQTLDLGLLGWRDPVTAPVRDSDSSRLAATPNPARGHTLFSGGPEETPGRLDILSADGRRLTSYPAVGPFSWDCSRMQAGVYFCRLTAGGKSVTTRVTVIR